MKYSVSNTKKKVYIRRIVFVISIMIFAMLQNTPNMFPSIIGANAILLVPLVCCISMFENDLTATFFGIFAGVLSDIVVSMGDGFNAVFYMFMASTISILITYFMRNNLSTALLLCGCSILLYTFLHWLFFVIFRGVEGGGALFFSFYLPTAIYTFSFVPLIYFVLRTFLRNLRDKYVNKSRT
ncbi:MAG: hypothetical protein GX241_02240 [Ruminococcaceae bacterium]|nr:hypothetical protein [Oscillospiraceae bacterium]